MIMTKRRMEFLRAVKYLYEEEGQPVHYIRVAERMNVSKWSAYDMLRALEKEGFLVSNYEINSAAKGRGRALVMFAPTPMLALTLSGIAPDSGISNREWRQTQERLLALFDDPKLNVINAIWDQLLTEMLSIKNPLTFCAYTIAIVFSQLQTLGSSSLRFVGNMAKNVLQGETGLTFLVGAAMGAINKMATQVTAVKMLSEYLTGFQKNLTLLTEVEQAMLRDFLELTLEKTVYAF